MKKLLVLALVFVGLAAFVYFYEIVGEESREKEKEVEESLFRLDEEDEIVGLEIVREGQDTILLKKVEENWVLEMPIQTSADGGTVDSLALSVKNADRERTLEDLTDDLSSYGLADPATRLKVSTSGDQITLLVGDKDFTGNQVYVQLEGAPEVFLTASSILTSLDKQLQDWRNKDVLDFERSELDTIQISREGEVLEFKKTDDQWYLEKPLRDLADQGVVSGVLSSLDSAEAQEFIVEEAGDLEPYGLDNPSLTVKVRAEGEDTWSQLQLGSEVEEKYYANDPQRGPVFTVNKSLFDDLNKEPLEYRSKDVVDVRQDEIAKLSVQGEQEITARREDFKWILEAPEEFKDREALSYKFWYPIDDIQFETILDEKRDLPDPSVSVTVTLEEGESQTFQFISDGDEYFAVQVSTEKQGTISKEDFDKLQMKAEDLAEEPDQEAESEE